ncbi:hypothetical protein HYDPIDRAFT_119139 [Hydnomerulius pinastri MD-312]|uniref:Uncharacterized protein n=1 Tax=Hydnomerulius pinastri MD-312 TaxID=994086 RepID=A0A0C9W7K8_9AGAM|nr:hypothetical protein HYDPIDRAFT_119139 [Hydnomerulius pinastri MD-312]
MSLRLNKHQQREQEEFLTLARSKPSKSLVRLNPHESSEEQVVAVPAKAGFAALFTPEEEPDVAETEEDNTAKPTKFRKVCSFLFFGMAGMRWSVVMQRKRRKKWHLHTMMHLQIVLHHPNLPSVFSPRHWLLEVGVSGCSVILGKRTSILDGKLGEGFVQIVQIVFLQVLVFTFTFL